MKVLLKTATLIDPGGKFSNQTADVLIEEGVISAIEPNIDTKGAEVIQLKNLHLSPGWLDLGTQAGEPGFEQRETLDTLAMAAVNGGYTALAVFPNTDPVIQRRADIDSLLKKSESLPVKILPIGAATQNCEGQNLNEYMDMAVSGAVAFSDGRNSIADSGALSRALIYATAANKPVINRPLHRNFSPFGVINEGLENLKLGLEGIPSEGETIALQQDISVHRYSEGRLIELGITSEQSIDLIKNRNPEMFFGVPVMNLLFTDSELSEFDTYCKVLPPLRSGRDQKALIKAVKKGIIDIVFSNHEPMEAELKEVEFGAAAFGASTLDTAFSMGWTALHRDLSIEDYIRLICHNPYRALSMEPGKIEVGEVADLSVFNPSEKITIGRGEIKSRSLSNPSIGKQLMGKVYGTVIGKEINLI
nr:amidohydrolase family protein [Saprospiraceae bacterium]